MFRAPGTFVAEELRGRSQEILVFFLFRVGSKGDITDRR